MAKYALALTSIALTATAQILLKLGVTAVGKLAQDLSLVEKILKVLLNPYVLGGLATYGVSTIIWLLAISNLKLSVAYPLVSLSYLLVVAASHYILGEAVTGGQKIGLALIMAGVLFLIR